MLDLGTLEMEDFKSLFVCLTFLQLNNGRTMKKIARGGMTHNNFY